MIGNAVKVMRIATGEEEEAASVKSVAAELGGLGGTARAASPLEEAVRDREESGSETVG